MNDDWRLRVDLRTEQDATGLTEKLQAGELEHDLESSFHDRVIVSRDHAEVFCYAGTRAQAEAAQRLIAKLASEHDWHVSSELKHWHPSAQEWEDPEKPLPQSDAERIHEHAELIAQERKEAEARGYAEWEVRVSCRSHHEAAALSHKLREEGVPHVHRWRYLLVGALDEDAARELAARIEREAPAGTKTSVEGTARAAAAMLPGNPFAVLGGIGA